MQLSRGARLVRLAVAAPALVAAMSLAACASSGTARPAPFPGAPVPTASRDTPERSAPASTTQPLVSKPEAAAVAPAIPLSVSELISSALKLRGTPYRQGGADPERGFDCSGYVKYVFSLAHIDLPRTVSQLYEIGKHESRDQVRAGDLLFFTTTAPGATHVAIAVGNGEFVHAPSSNGVVRVEALSSSYWSPRFLGARRILP